MSTVHLWSIWSVQITQSLCPLSFPLLPVFPLSVGLAPTLLFSQPSLPCSLSVWSSCNPKSKLSSLSSTGDMKALFLWLWSLGLWCPSGSLSVFLANEGEQTRSIELPAMYQLWSSLGSYIEKNDHLLGGCSGTWVGVKLSPMNDLSIPGQCLSQQTEVFSLVRQRRWLG